LVGGPFTGRDEGPMVYLSDREHIKQVFRTDPGVVLTGETNMFLPNVVGTCGNAD